MYHEAYDTYIPNKEDVGKALSTLTGWLRRLDAAFVDMSLFFIENYDSSASSFQRSNVVSGRETFQGDLLQ